MKLFNTLIILISYTLLSIISSFNFTFQTKADMTYYAKITGGAFLYTSTDENAKIFLLPQTYFVELLSNAGENYYEARYNDIYGYVKKSEVIPIKQVPATPFLTNITFRVFVPSGANLRSTPYNNGPVNLVYAVPFLDSNFSYYGTMDGEEAISHKGTLWYYCKYYSNNVSYNGYIYAPLCDMLTTFSNNEEEYEAIEGELKFASDIKSTTVNAIEKMSITAQTLIIIAISLPCLLFIYLLFKPTLLAETKGTSSQSKTKKKKKKISRLKHSDYYEFNDDDF